MKIFLSAILATVCLAQPIDAKTITLDFDEYADLWTYTGDTDTYCLTQDHITHCEENYAMYDHASPNKLLSDYDFFAATSYRANDGYLFTPLSFDIVGVFNALSRIRCSDLPGVALCRKSIEYQFPDGLLPYLSDFQKVEYDFLVLSGYRDGALIARSQYDPEGMSTFVFGSEFANLDRLDIKVIGMGELFNFDREGYTYWADGYGYTCAIHYGSVRGEGYCNRFTYDNFTMLVQPPAVPVPATGILLLGVLAGLPLLARRGRIAAR